MATSSISIGLPHLLRAPGKMLVPVWIITGSPCSSQAR